MSQSRILKYNHEAPWTPNAAGECGHYFLYLTFFRFPQFYARFTSYKKNSPSLDSDPKRSQTDPVFFHDHQRFSSFPKLSAVCQSEKITAVRLCA